MTAVSTSAVMSQMQVKYWDLWMGLQLLFTALVTPYQVAFLVTRLDGGSNRRSLLLKPLSHPVKAARPPDLQVQRLRDYYGMLVPNRLPCYLRESLAWVDDLTSRVKTSRAVQFITPHRLA